MFDKLKNALSERMPSAKLDDHLENEGGEGIGATQSAFVVNERFIMC